MRLRLLIAAAATMLLQACMAEMPVDSAPPQVATATSASAATPAAQSYLFSWGMFADPVFDRDVVTFNRAFAQAYGAPADSALFGFTSNRLSDPSPQAMDAALQNLATQAVDGQDTVVVMMTSHGSPDVLAVKSEPNGGISAIDAQTLSRILAPLAADRQIIILQACFSGSLIDDLRSPNRIILTAAAADRSSFGCNPDSDNTWFIKSLNRAMVEVTSQGGSWQQVFARTRALVAADEAAVGVLASNPQSYVGANMRDIWTQPSR